MPEPLVLFVSAAKSCSLVKSDSSWGKCLSVGAGKETTVSHADERPDQQVAHVRQLPRQETVAADRLVAVQRPL